MAIRAMSEIPRETITLAAAADLFDLRASAVDVISAVHQREEVIKQVRVRRQLPPLEPTVPFRVFGREFDALRGQQQGNRNPQTNIPRLFARSYFAFPHVEGFSAPQFHHLAPQRLYDDVFVSRHQTLLFVAEDSADQHLHPLRSRTRYFFLTQFIDGRRHVGSPNQVPEAHRKNYSLWFRPVNTLQWSSPTQFTMSDHPGLLFNTVAVLVTA